MGFKLKEPMTIRDQLSAALLKPEAASHHLEDLSISQAGSHIWKELDGLLMEAADT